MFLRNTKKEDFIFKPFHMRGQFNERASILLLPKHKQTFALTSYKNSVVLSSYNTLFLSRTLCRFTHKPSGIVEAEEESLYRARIQLPINQFTFKQATYTLSDTGISDSQGRNVVTVRKHRFLTGMVSEEYANALSPEDLEHLAIVYVLYRLRKDVDTSMLKEEPSTLLKIVYPLALLLFIVFSISYAFMSSPTNPIVSILGIDAYDLPIQNINTLR